MAAEIVHVGRRSGRRYTTPVAARRVGDVIVIPMTFGTSSDRARNVRAAGGCSIRLRSEDYGVVQPRGTEPAGSDAADPVRVRPVERIGFGMLGIQQYMRPRITPVEP